MAGPHIHPALALLLQHEADPGVVDGVLGHHLRDLVVLLGGRAQRRPPGGNVVEEILDGDGGALVGGGGRGSGHHLAVPVLAPADGGHVGYPSDDR